MKETMKFLFKQKEKLLVIFLLLLFTNLLFAQPVQITGSVKDATTGDALPGVNILVKGTYNGTITGLDGTYTLVVNVQNPVLVFSFVGYSTQEIDATGKTIIDVSLKEDLMKLDEVVVIAYGKAKKSDLTGSVASLTSDDFNKGAVSTPEQLMQGKVAGVQITSNSGEPGSGAVIRVRGASSIRSGQMPLYVIDGVPLDMQSTAPDGLSASGMGGAAASNPLTFINPEDIESITVLKDASASAIYGSRAANGVIIVTTKKGKEGTTQLTYSTYASASMLPKKIDVLNAKDFVKFRVQLLGLTENDPSHYGYSTDWQDQVFRTGFTQSHNVSVTGGTPKTSYNASFNYFDQQGIIKKTELQRYTGHMNLTHKALKDRLTFEASLTASRINETKAPIGGVTGFEGDLSYECIAGKSYLAC